MFICRHCPFVVHVQQELARLGRDYASKGAYRGQLDDTRPNRGTANGRDLRAALDAVLGRKPVNPDQRPSVGCGIKWKA